MENELGTPIELYKARVVEIIKEADEVIIYFIYYGSKTKNVHYDTVFPSSKRYESAIKLQKGDEVLVAPCDYDKIYRFKIHGKWKRLWIRAINFLNIF